MFPLNIIIAGFLWRIVIVAANSIEDPLLLIISFDGFRYDYLDKIPTPNFKRFAESGVKAKWMNNVYVTKTFPNHFSMATGLYEESHGIIGNSMYDLKIKKKFNLSSTEPEWWDNGIALPIWVANQMAGPNRHSGSVMWAGANVLIRNQTADYKLNYNASISWEQRVDTALSWLTQKVKPANLVMMYIEEPDGYGHMYGPDSEQVHQKVIEVDSLLEYLMDKMRHLSILNRTNMLILSDHGMASVHEDRIIEMDKILNRSAYEAYGHSPVWNIQPVDGNDEYVYQKLLEGSKIFSYTLYKKENIPDEYHYKNNPRVLKYLIEADEGFDIVFSGKLEGRGEVWGEHGYNPNFESMHPIFLASGPSFKKNFTAEPFLNLDVYPLMCHLLGIPTPPNNGSFERVRQLLSYHKPTFMDVLFNGSWVVAGATLLCICLAATLTGAALSMACQKPKERVSFVLLQGRPFPQRRKERSSLEEKQELLLDDDSD